MAACRPLTSSRSTISKAVRVAIVNVGYRSTNYWVVSAGTRGNGGWDSGRLSSAESYTLQFSGEGTFTYADRANPSSTAQFELSVHLAHLPNDGQVARTDCCHPA